MGEPRAAEALVAALAAAGFECAVRDYTWIVEVRAGGRLYRFQRGSALLCAAEVGEALGASGALSRAAVEWLLGRHVIGGVITSDP